jgi:hypothetical protein
MIKRKFDSLKSTPLKAKYRTIFNLLEEKKIKSALLLRRPENSGSTKTVGWVEFSVATNRFVMPKWSEDIQEGAYDLRLRRCWPGGMTMKVLRKWRRLLGVNHVNHGRLLKKICALSKRLFVISRGVSANRVFASSVRSMLLEATVWPVGTAHATSWRAVAYL